MVTLHAEGYRQEDLAKSVESISNDTQLFSMATLFAGDQVEPWINTAYFSFDASFHYYYLSSPQSVHSKNLLTSPLCALSLFNTQQSAENGKQGLQIFGECRRAEGKYLKRGLLTYQKRFVGFENTIRIPEDFDKGIIESKLYCVTAHTIKIFDEQRFGEETWVEAKVIR